MISHSVYLEQANDTAVLLCYECDYRCEFPVDMLGVIEENRSHLVSVGDPGVNHSWTPGGLAIGVVVMPTLPTLTPA